MHKKLDHALRRLFTRLPQPQADPLETQFQNNPLVGYLHIFQNQHRVIYLLYRGLIIAFAGFLTLVSFLLYNAADQLLIPDWTHGALITIDLVLALCLVQALRQLRRYKQRSSQVLQRVESHLFQDLAKLEKFKHEQSFISDTHHKIKHRLKMMSKSDEKLFSSPGEEHLGWDARSCPSCGMKVELLSTACPRCQHQLDEPAVN